MILSMTLSLLSLVHIMSKKKSDIRVKTTVREWGRMRGLNLPLSSHTAKVYINFQPSQRKAPKSATIKAPAQPFLSHLKVALFWNQHYYLYLCDCYYSIDAIIAAVVITAILTAFFCLIFT